MILEIVNHLIASTTAYTISIEIRCCWYIPTVDGRSKCAIPTSPGYNLFREKQILVSSKTYILSTWTWHIFILQTRTFCSFFIRVWIVSCPRMNETVTACCSFSRIYDRKEGCEKDQKGLESRSHWFRS